MVACGVGFTSNLSGISLLFGASEAFPHELVSKQSMLIVFS